MGDQHGAKLPTNDGSESSGESDWLDVEPDEEQSTVVSLFGPETFSTPSEMLEHDKTKNGFDLLVTIRRLHLDFYGAIKLINFIRHQVQQGQSLPDPISAEHIEDELYLKPVLDNDALLFNLDEILEGEQADNAADSSLAHAPADELLARNKALEAELEAIRDQFTNYRLAVEETLDKRWGDDTDAGPSTSVPKKDNSEYYFESYAHNGMGKPL